MFEKSFGLLYYLKQPKNSASMRYVYCRITVDGVPKEFSTKRKCKVSDWNQDFGKMEGNSQEAKSLNSYIDSVTNLVYNAKRQLIESGKTVSSQGIKDIILGVEEKKHWLMEIYRRYNVRARSLIGKDYVADTVNRFDRIERYAQQFIIAFYKVNDLELKRLDYEFIDEFANYIRVIRGCSKNTTQRYIATFKSVIIDCLKKKWILSDPFSEFKIKKVDVDVNPLSAEELNRVQTKEFYCERLNLIRDVFVFCCFTGLAYADVSRLTWSHIEKDELGERWIKIKRKKTGTLSAVPLLPEAKAILFKHGIKQKCRASGRALMTISNQKMNAYLKEIGDLCRFKHEPHAHMARHTFATTVTLANGVPIESVSRMLGHKSISQTQHYAKVVDMKLRNDMGMLKEKLNAKQGREEAPNMVSKASETLNKVLCVPTTFQLLKSYSKDS